MSSETHGLNALSESALRDRYTANRARHDELQARRAEGTITVTEAQELRAVAAETNQIVELVSAFSVGDETVADLPSVIVPKAAEPVVETFVEGQEADLAEAVAAAAQLAESTAVSRRHGDGDDVKPVVQQSLIASAASTQGTIQAGAAITLEDVGELVSRLAYDQGRNGESIALVTLTPAIAAGAGKVSSGNSRLQNTRIFNEAIMADNDRDENGALTAAPFTVCGPPDILRSVPECDNTARYVPGWFRQIQSDHGQIEFYRSFSLADVLPGVNTWDQVDQTAINPTLPATWKSCIDIGCLPTETIGVEAVVQCMTMPVFQMMTSPEAVASAIHAIRAATARVADGQLLRFYDQLSSAYSFNAATTVLGSTIDVYDILGRLLGMGAAANRQLDLSGYTLALEVGMLETLMLDNQMACNPRAAQEAAENLFAGLGIGRIEVTPDWSDAVGAGPYSPLLPINPPGAPAIPVPARPTTYRVRLFDSNDFAMLSPGGDSFGIIPDLDNKRQNKVTWFGEIYQGLGKLGCKPAWTVEFTNLAATGVRAACA